MLKHVSQIGNLRAVLIESWGKAVEKLWIGLGQTSHLSTSSTFGLLEISQTTTLARFLAAVCPQAERLFTHPDLVDFHLLGGNFCSLSTGLIDANEFKKD